MITREALLLTLESKFIQEFFLKVASVPVSSYHAQAPQLGRARLPQAHCFLKALFPLTLCTDLTFFTCTCIFSYVIRIYYRIFLLCHSSILTGMALQAMLILAVNCRVWSVFTFETISKGAK